MTIEEIRNTCITASEVYYNYLEDNEKGIYTIYIRGIEKVGKDKLKLRINGKIFDQETLIFKYLATNKEYTTEHVQIKVHDNDSNTLIIKPNAEVYKLMKDANVNDWQIISDLKFLVERVREWYEYNGASVALPKKPSTLAVPNDTIFHKDSVPSDEQRKALYNIFTHPLSYIWGAPGTGKTQFVLSYAILHYLANHKKVGIVAPTNHALEQIFRGVIKMTDKAGIKRDNILRLGGPSKKFADEFPEVCEIIGLEKQLQEVQKQLDVIERILGIGASSKEIMQLKKGIELIERIQHLLPQLSPLETSIKNTAAKKKQLQKDSDRTRLRIEAIKKEQLGLEKKRDSFWSGIFSRKTNFEKLINDCIDKRIAEEELLKKFNATVHELQEQYRKDNETLAAVNSEIQSCLGRFNAGLQDHQLGILTLQNLVQIKTVIGVNIDALTEDNDVYTSLAIEYEKMDRTVLKEKYKKLIAEKEKLHNYSIQERLKNVSIIGATLDSYLYRFKEEKLGVDHIFLDEAGYSNIIKAMTVFNQEVPVTFLGDHMQLPPVCEISKQDIQNNQDFRPVMVWDQSAIYLEDIFQHDTLEASVLRYIQGSPASFQRMVKTNLTKTYRFGASLASVLQQYVYTQGFKSGLQTETEIIVLKVENPAAYRNNNRHNRAEAEAITALLQQQFMPDDSVAVLAPYNLQIRALSRALPEFQRQNKILTVHKSQGQEWDTVIYSVCDIGNGKTPWFTDSTNSMSNGLNNINTAVSRAKKRLVIVCNPNEWQFFSNQLITGLLRVATKQMSYDIEPKH